MTDLSLLFQKISFTYDRATQPIIRNLSVHFTPGWTGIVGANGVGKSTILKLASGDLEPRQGRVYSTRYVQNMRHNTIPEGALKPGQSYRWRIRVTDGDHWKKVQNSTRCAWQIFHIR